MDGRAKTLLYVGQQQEDVREKKNLSLMGLKKCSKCS